MMNQVADQLLLFEQQLMVDNQVELKLIDDSNQQSGDCYAIVFDQTGSIMVTCEDANIKIWIFEQGRFKLSNSYKRHTETILCLVYSKQRNNFISGSIDQTLICWQQINQKEWKSSQTIQQHNNWEDQLISGSFDQSIKVWEVDFIKNELTFLYTLNQHANRVLSLSFNQSENVLASCGYEEFIIWEKGSQGKWEFRYKQDVPVGCKLCFINDQQFIWVTDSRNIEAILVFEQQNGVFQQNSKKTIKLIQSNQCSDDISFQIIQNEEKNMILLKHQLHIYLIRHSQDNTFKIILSFNCQTQGIYGTMTNNGQYLVFWNKKNYNYSSYEILNQ